MADAGLLFHIIDIDVGIGGEGIVTTGEFAAGIRDLVAVGGEVELLEAAEGLGGQFIRRTVEDIDALAQFLSVERGIPGVRDVLHEMVPVAVHQAFNGAGRGFFQIGVDVHGLFRDLEFRDIHHVFPTGVELEFRDATRHVAHLAGTGAVGVHDVDLAALEVGDALAAVDPAGVGNALRGVGQLPVAAAVDVHHEEIAVAAVFFNRSIGHAIEDFLAVGRDLQVGDLAQLVHDFGREMSVDDRDIVFLEHGFRRRTTAASTDHCHKKEKKRYSLHNVSYYGFLWKIYI